VKKILSPKNVKWDFFNNNRSTLEYKKYLHLKNPPLYIISTDASTDAHNDEILYLDGPLDQFFSKYSLLNSTFDLPAGVNEHIYLGALRHLKREIMTSLNIRLIISGLAVAFFLPGFFFGKFRRFVCEIWLKIGDI